MARVKGQYPSEMRPLPDPGWSQETQREGGRNPACGLKGTQPGHTASIPASTAASHPCTQERASGCQAQQTLKDTQTGTSLHHSRTSSPVSHALSKPDEFVLQTVLAS